MRSLLRSVPGMSSGPTYSRLDDGNGTPSDGRHSPLEMERRPMLQNEDGDDEPDYDLDTGSRTSREKLFPSTRRRRPLFVTTLWVTLLAAVSIVGGVWVYHRLFPGYDEIPDFDEISPPVELLQVEDGTVILDNDDSHVLVPIRSSLPETDGLLGPMETRPPLDDLVYYYQTGDLPSAVHFPQPSVDLVYLYVDSSSPYFGDARKAQLNASQLTLGAKTERHWRDNGEFRGAIRSGALGLTGRVKRIHVVSAAFDFENDMYKAIPDEGIVGWQMGQVPEWIDWANKSNVHWHFHPEIYRLPRDNDGKLAESIKDVDEGSWRDEALPTFNSFGIEARLPWVTGLSEEFVYSNDDMFILRELTHGDFHHPLYGTVMRLDPGISVIPLVKAEQRSDSGEWGGLNYASQLLSQRFPHRSRMYMHHMPKSMKRSLIQEVSIMFAAQLTEAGTRAFRESKKGIADIEMAWLAVHLQIERWREALLWTWAVARVGDLEGNWGREARDALRDALHLSWGSEKGSKVVVDITKDHRETIQNFEHVSAQGAWEMPEATEILYTSLDGHMHDAPYSEEEWKLKKKLERKPRKGVKIRPVPPTQCTFDVDECLPADFWSNESGYTAAEMFKHLAFAKSHCGDCLINALINASGNKGLSAFLPRSDKVYSPPARTPQMWDREEPILPLTDKWEDADFSLAHNVRLGQDKWHRSSPKEYKDNEVNLLDWSVKLLSRYAYVYAITPSRFAMVHSVYQMHKTLKGISTDENLALACINDDRPDKKDNHVRVQLQRFLKDMFGQESKFVQWERPNIKWDTED